MRAAAFLRSLFDAAVAAADPELCVPAHLPPAPRGRTLVVGAGKAAATMARAVEQHWPGELGGLVLTRYGHCVRCERIKVVEAAHPLPDAAGVAAAERVLQLASGLTADDLLLCLLSGGGSALLCVPAPGISLDDKREVTRQLLNCGASIAEINCVRKHLSAIKGGRLALAAMPARVHSLAISDVPGDDLAVIASGPTIADPGTRAEATAVLDRYSLRCSPQVMNWLASEASETPKPGDAHWASVSNELVATPQRSLLAAAELARAAGCEVQMLGDALQGEARDCAAWHAGVVQSLPARTAGQRPVLLLSGGETTVTMRGSGRGGRNSEFLLALALQLQGRPGVHALACDTDGIDGSEDNAGAYCGPDTLARAGAAGLDPQARLADNDAYGFFCQLGDLVVTGPTRTNVNDFRAILIEGVAA